MNAYKRGQYVILNNGKGMIGHGTICKITKIFGLKVWLKAPWMHGDSHTFATSQVLPMPKLSIKPIMRLTVQQNQWLSNYYDMTGFEPMHMDEIEMGTMSFEKAAEHNLLWYEDHTSETFLTITQEYHDLETNDAS